MARGGGRRTYVRDGNGRFASTPGGGPAKRTTPKARRAATRAGNRLNRDNLGRISGIGRDGATVRGGRLRTAAGNRRATQTASMKVAGFRPGVIAKGGRGVSGKVARSLAAARKERTGALGLSRARPGQVGRALARAQANDKRLLQPAMRGTEVRTKAGVGLAVARGAQDYYTGKMPRRKATFSPLTSSRDKKALAARRKRVVDNTKAAKPAKPARARRSTKTNAATSGLQPGGKTRAARPAGTVAKPKGLKVGALAERWGQKMKVAIQTRRGRISTGDMFIQRTRGTKAQKQRSLTTRTRAAAIYRAQESLRNTGQLIPDAIKRGTPKLARQAAERAANRRPYSKPRPARTVYRTRSEAMANQKERNRRISEFAKSAPGFSREWQNGPQSITRKAIKVNQGNLLTGKTDRVTANTRSSQSSMSRIGESAASKRTQVRRSRAEARYDAILSERKSITGKGRVKAGALAQNSQRMEAVGRAFRVYDMGTGRRPPRRRTGSRVRNSGDRI